MRILVGSVMNVDLIKESLLNMEQVKLTYEGKKGLNMVFSCQTDNEKATLRLIKDHLKTIPELGGTFYNVSISA